MAARFPAAEGDGQGGGLKIPAGTAPDAPFVTVLDPATGTATFLVEVIDVIHKHLQAKWAEGGLAAVPALSPLPSGEGLGVGAAPRTFADYWNLYVPQRLLPRLFGYELLMAPYAIAHMKIANKLTETGFHQFDRLGEGNRVRIYLTNALEPASDAGQLNLEGVLPALANEAKAVNAVKRDQRFTVVVGNPPYAGHSANASKNEDGRPNFIGKLLRDYYEVDGKPLGERNPKWLQDDYVKFIRLAQYIIEHSGVGLTGLITNHAFLDNATFRGARHSLLMSFDKAWLLDLHGNTKKKEQHPDGSIDVNVFEIQQGVAISFLLHGFSGGSRLINHASLFGTRDKKYSALKAASIEITAWQTINPCSPFFLLIPQNQTLFEEYQRFTKITEVMPIHSNGVVTARDHLCISWNAKDT